MVAELEAEKAAEEKREKRRAARAGPGGKGMPGMGAMMGELAGALAPYRHISCLYELQPVGPGDATIGPCKEKVSNGHFSWGRPPFAPDVDPDVTRVEGQPGDCVATASAAAAAKPAAPAAAPTGTNALGGVRTCGKRWCSIWN